MKLFISSATPRLILAALGLTVLVVLLSPAATLAGGPPRGGFMYNVQYGDSLGSIASRYGIPVETLMHANSMTSRYTYIGRQLYMPPITNYSPQYGMPYGYISPNYGYAASSYGNNYSRPYAPYGGYAGSSYGSGYSSGYSANYGYSVPSYGGYSQNPYGQSGYGGSVYIVRPGDTLFSIAQRFGVSQAALMSANYIYNPNYIYSGMRMTIPSGGYASSYGGSYPSYGGSYPSYGGGYPIPSTGYPSYGSYVVQPGDTLTSIAIRYGTTAYTLAVANNIPNPNLIYSGTRLNIPSAGSSAYSSGGYPVPSTNYPAPVPGTPNSSSVSMQNIMYAPQSINVKVGTQVTWKNNETSQVPHTVTSGTPNAASGTFDSGNLNPGQTFQFTFNTPGTFQYFCRVHGAAMTGTVTVTQ